MQQTIILTAHPILSFCGTCYDMELPPFSLIHIWCQFAFCHYALLLTPACWKSNTNARLMASARSLALDPTFGIHSHKTLDTAQPCHLLKPNWKPSSSHSISILTNISTQFLLQSVYVCVCLCVCVCECVCVCVCACVFVVRFYYYYFIFIYNFFFFFFLNNTLCKLFW